MNEPQAHLVFLQPEGLLIVKRPEADWRQLQDEYADYVVSFGPWTEAEIVEYFASDYGADDNSWPFKRQEIVEFMQSPDTLVFEA